MLMETNAVWMMAMKVQTGRAVTMFGYLGQSLDCSSSLQLCFRPRMLTSMAMGSLVDFNSRGGR